MMIFFNNLVSVFYDLNFIIFLALLLNLIIFTDYQSQADPHKNKIENLKMVISNNIKIYIVIVSMVVFLSKYQVLSFWSIKNAFLECLQQSVIRTVM